MRAGRLSLAAVLAFALIAFAAAPAALATPGVPFILTGSFDGSATPDGSFEAASIGVNGATGHVLVVDNSHSAVLQFDESGNPVPFTALGSVKRPIPLTGEIAVDNSGGPSQGNFYVLRQGTSVEGFAPSGAKLAGWPVLPSPTASGPLAAVTVDPDGNVWLAYPNTASTRNPYAEELTPSGTRTGTEIDLTGAKYATGCGNCQQIAFDSHMNIYYSAEDGSLVRRSAGENYAKPLNVKGELSTSDIAVDPSNDDVYFNHGTNIAVTEYTEPYAELPPSVIFPGLKTLAQAFSGDGQTLFATEGSKINIFKRQLPEPPQVVAPVSFSKVKSESAYISGLVDTGGGAPATFFFEYGPDATYGQRFPAGTDYQLPHTTFGPQEFIGLLGGLKPDTTYHVRYVITNASGTDVSADAVIKTLPASLTDAPDPCENALARKQTGARTLADCRAYELVSAAYTGGSDVESPMVAGQEPFGGYPDADGRVLYGVNAGVIPGPWNPTNHGVDPYVAVRGASGWTTEYVGLPANLSPDKSSFASALGAADAGLRTFAFAGPDLCDPCFAEDPATGIPLRRPDGQLTQAMVGENPPASNIKPEGKVAKMLSADGRHLVFGSQSALVDGANSSGGNLNIFDRDLVAGTTQLVSTTSGGTAIQAGDGVSELDLSSDGSRILIGTRVSEDPAGNEYVRPSMHIGSSADSVDLAPGASSGVIFDGMTADGSKVFFTSPQALVGTDTDTAADVYEAAVDADGGVDLSLATPAGSAGACSPVANGAGAHWNSVGAAADCGAVAIGGGAGVSRQNGTLYYLSPEAQGGSGVADQPNLYALSAAGGATAFVATLSPDDPLVIRSVHDAGAAEGAEFETSPSGRFATFRSTASLTGVDNAGHPSVFLYDGAPPAGGAALVCPSCNATLTEDPGMKAEATLADNGLSLTDDGRVFFNTPAPLGVEDTGGKRDVYEWVGGRTNLISSGIGRFDSELLTTTHDGTDVYFFTHDTLDSTVDQNQDRTKIYDARSNGGFFTLPVKPQCAASDECHGPGTEAAGAPQIGSSGKTSDGNYSPPGSGSKGCSKGKVKRKGKCVKKPKQQKKHAKKGKRHHG